MDVKRLFPVLGICANLMAFEIDPKENCAIDPLEASLLVQAAKEGMRNAFTSSGKKTDARFGAAVLTTKGNIYYSGQYFSDTLSLTLHAEQAALAHAAAHGEYGIVAIACLGNLPAYQLSGDVIYPCNLCKQLLWESSLRSGLNTEILIIDENEHIIERFSLFSSMNHPWPMPRSSLKEE